MATNPVTVPLRLKVAAMLHDRECSDETCEPTHYSDLVALAIRVIDIVRAQTLAEAAACAECFSDEAAHDLWERAERAGWKFG